ncbi:oxidoreductase [Pontibacter cellulosilyticus]|uniref:SDR family NAD(P)-dependent oxidoreductase n=1 Tax=Pontibacter cellulosilyticus TaxID=1720253 RepID=A0A923N2Z2_9BACT|nr:oxidoreductase [Pontibacter cellulosilyticus]MBC5991281.1 SDR family NAD(P)-dependent oxidoreductase [Pontibacter cellulosilyticus]
MKHKGKVWFITGVSSGFGRELAKEVAAHGDKVIGTVRKKEQVQEFNDIAPGITFAHVLDVTQRADVISVMQKTYKQFEQLDMVVNNAGFGFLGAIEEASVVEVREVMETNFYGALHVTQAALPIFREQKHGHFLQISSVAGFRGTQGFGVYNASKFALEGFSEALAQEVAPFNIKVTIVEPGPFRTNFAGPSIKRADDHIDAYAETAGAFERAMHERNGKQDGDPAKAAEVLWQVVNSEDPPLRLPLGQIAYEAVRTKMRNLENDLWKWERTATKTSFET